MPELPDVEVVIHRIRPKVLNREIVAVETPSPPTVRYPDPVRFTRLLRGKRFLSVDRRGKYILFQVNDGRVLVVHLRMTGDLLVEPQKTPAHRHTRLRLGFSDGSELRFVDTRRLGQVHLIRPEEVHILKGLSNLGPEPLDPGFTLAEFRRRLANQRGVVKSVLLRQEFIAGLGNIYADEVLFQAGLSPLRRVEGLRPDEVKVLYLAIRRVLRQAVDNLMRSGDPGGNLLPVREEDAPCPRCGTPIETVRVSGRSAYFCPRCQPAPPRRHR